MQMALFTPFALENFPRGNWYLFYEFIMDFGGVIILVGVTMAFIRRLFMKPKSLGYAWDDWYALILLMILPLAGFTTEAMRLIVTNPDWASFSFMGNIFANFFRFFGVTPQIAFRLQQTFFLIHIFLALAFVVSIPFTKLRHLIFAPLNIIRRPRRAMGALEKVEDIAQRTTHEIRTMLFAMRPVILETQGLLPALNQYADRLNQNEPFHVSIVNRGYEGQLDPDAEGVVFAIIEEAISNAKKHAQASEIRIGLGAGDDALFVEIRDNGVGFDVERTQSTYDQRTSLGLINMNERAEIVGGECDLESARGRGTAVKVKIPYRQTIE